MTRTLGPRVAVGAALAVVASAAALLAAVGPADDQHSRYVWPPAELPPESPGRAWVAPLALVRGKAERLTVRLPCVPPPPLRENGAAGATTVLATARHPETAGGLALTAAPEALLLAVGADGVSRIPWPPGDAAGPGCVKIGRASCRERV